MANIGFNDNSSELFELYDKSDKNSGVGYIDNYDGLQMSDLLNSGKTLKKPIIVEELPTNGVESQIYLVKNQNSLNDENMYIEYLWVDGKFEQDKRDITLKFRGSSNQRVINVRESLKQNKVIELELD